MAIKLKIPRAKAGKFHPSNPIVRAAVATFIIISMMCLGVFAFYYVRYEKVIDQRMSGPIFANSAKIYAAPKTVQVGDNISLEDVITELKRSGYVDAAKGDSRLGTFKVVNAGIEIRPGPESYHSTEGAVVRFKAHAVDSISSLDNGGALDAYELEPVLVTGLFDGSQRSKRRIVTYDDMPNSLVNAVLAIEDRRFFQHSGVNYYRILEAAIIDFRRGGKAQGGSTLTMQIARNLILDTNVKKYSRKIAEIMVAIELEQRYTKQQIFDFYANQVDLGQRGSFTINGFGEAAQAYFGKDVKNLTLPESALLAGLVQRPSYLSPYRHPERALARRNLVLQSMVETGAITRDEAENVKAMPLKIQPPNVEASDAPYFVDLVKDDLLNRFSEQQLSQDGMRIYTTLDPDLQKAAADAVDIGLKTVDALVLRRRTHKKKIGKGRSAKYETTTTEGPMPQVALVAMDPKTGQILALVGGRNYAMSQLDHAVAMRPTGSIFKPFVYTAALNQDLDGLQPPFTPATIIDDSKGTFAYEDKVYEPRNFEDEYFGPVTARFALAHSLNNATVRLAEQVGYDKVAALAQTAGIKTVKATPAMAIGAYDATPIQMASAYTAFANHGVLSKPMMVSSLRDAKGNVMEEAKVEQKTIIDPRIAYIITNMMEAVINNGTAAGVRAQGFTSPAAGKTGTSHDAWFAGYTSNLLCVVWVGMDDYTDLKIEGAHSAAPIWAEFMKKAVKLPAYQDVKPFTAPDGVVVLTLDKVTNKVATPSCPETYQAAFLAGTEPTETCDQAIPDQRNVFQKLFGLGPKPAAPPPVSNNPGQQSSSPQPGQPVTTPPPKKKGFFGRLFGGKGDDNKSRNQQPAQPDKPH